MIFKNPFRNSNTTQVSDRDQKHRDHEYINSLSAAVLQVTPRRVRTVLYVWVFSCFLLIFWAALAEIDEIVRGTGEVIPSGENQVVQNLEGGVVDKILVSEGDTVEQGQVLLRLSNQKSQSSFDSGEIKAKALEARIARLKAEAHQQPFKITDEMRENYGNFILNEQDLYAINAQRIKAELNVVKEQLLQREAELKEAQTRRTHLQDSLSLIQEEVSMTKPMVAKGVRSKIDFLKLKREMNEIEQQYNAINDAIPRLKSAIQEARGNIQRTESAFQTEAQKKLNDTVADLQALQANTTAFEDEVRRTVIRSPMKGVVQTLYVQTLGGVVRPGEDIVEIVPSEQALLVEVKIKPKDIAFIYRGQKAIVKFSAYDFSIYGGLAGKVVHISADTITDSEKNTFYTVRIKTDKNYIGADSERHKLIPGMTASADIITGKKTVLDYILKPILKAKQYAFTER